MKKDNDIDKGDNSSDLGMTELTISPAPDKPLSITNLSE